MRVMTWNVWWRFGGNWRERQRGIAATLDDLRPDVVGLQEAWSVNGTSQADVLAGRLGMHAVFAGPSLPPLPDRPDHPDQAGVELGVAILSRWPVLEAWTHRLPAVHRHRPVALVATLDHPKGPLRAACSCVEWELEYADDHLAQAQALANLLTDPALDGPLPVLLTADLNAAPQAPQIAPLTEVMVDCWVAGGGAPDAATLRSANPFAPREARQQIDRRIDYVLARPGVADRPVRVRRAFAVDEPVDGLHPSDHAAVLVDIEP
jgi:endonuclease/exonuclease/phosphatase family metal-dependent hydrolase